MLSTLITVLLVLAALGLLILTTHLVGLRKRNEHNETQLRQERSKYDADQKEWHERAAGLDREVQRLSRWKDIADADEKAAEMLHVAQASLDKAKADADALVLGTRQETDRLTANAKAEAETIVLTARQEVKKSKDEAKAVLDSATIQASGIVEAAKKRAEEIAGSAYVAMENASLYEQTAKAMKNVVDGYGDRYMVPERSLLDDLAEEFGYTQAGIELKNARECSKAMVSSRIAGTCEYVEVNRRTTAVNFVVDAFNGMVDSILSRVRHDNVGTLQQETRDAFTLVNYNGKAFREARITEEYLAARLAELRWAATVQQLRVDEREEQKRIREHIREEEKARKEYERVVRDAAREEELLRKAVEKALQQVEHASEAQKARYEQQLKDLAERLREAEERSQRAISMAQQTKRGHVYIISNIGSFGENVYKIGLTRRLEPLDRVRELGDSSVPFEFDVHALIFSENAPGLEGQLHKHFLMAQMNKVNHRREFFRVDMKHIREEIETLGLTAKWTMTADAREYRETLAIENAIKDNPGMRDAWVNRQLRLEDLEPPTEELVESLTE